MKRYAILILACSTGLLLSSCRQGKDTLFEPVSPAASHIRFTNTPYKHKAFGILYYLYYYNGGGVAIGDINNDGLPDIYFTANHKGGNKLYLNKGNFQFEDITSTAGVAGTSDWCTGVTMADVNGDGYLDIYVCAVQGEHGLKGRNELFINKGKTANGSVAFTESAESYGLALSAWSTQSVFFDYDHDGDLDCFVLNQSHHPNENIVDTANRRRFDADAASHLYRNDLSTTGRFTDVSAAAGIYQSSLGYGLGLAVADLNNDGWDDIYIGNDFHENDYYYINQGNVSGSHAGFTESGAAHFGHYSRFSMGNDIADYNNDGQPDIVTVDMLPPDEKTLKTYGSDENYDIYRFKILHNGFQNQVSRNCLQLNNGNGISFNDIGLMAGISATDWSWCPLLADFDNDGNKDLFISSGIVKRPVDLDYIRFVSDLAAKINRNGSDEYDAITLKKMPDGASHPFLFRGSGSLAFTDMSDAWGTGGMKGYYNGAAYADLDNDGRLDLVVNCIDAPALILKNKAPARNYLNISCKGNKPNLYGIGTKVYLFAGGKMQYQQLMATRGFQSSSDLQLHFGLDSLHHIDSLLVVWPDQQYQVLKNIAAGKTLAVAQENASGYFQYQQFFPPPPPVFKDISSQLHTGWKHRENDFIDFNTQYLIPHMQSARGPKLAVADVNKDGLDDFFACGAKGQSGSLMLQTKEGKFAAADEAVFRQAAASEGTGAVFFDANGDGWPDLLVVSGGNEYADGHPALADHLYLNDKTGHFKPAPPGALPAYFTNKTCVAVADIDRDGDSDIFIGGFAGAASYGEAQPSYLLLNDGKGNFTPASAINLKDAGMVTSASFADINADGWPDLVMAGEWMPIKIFLNNKGTFSETVIPGSTGLWQTVFITDINADGYPDILAGNWGHNSKLYAGKDGPLKLYVKDFDRNGSLDQVMAYTINGKEYTFLAKDELEREMPVLKKAYLNYHEVAGQTVQYMFYDLFKDYKELKAEILGSTAFLNDGKGHFTALTLPEQTQFAPVMAFHSLNGSWLAAGNFYGVIPYEGRYDALRPTIFGYNNAVKQFHAISSLPAIEGEIRDAQWLRYANGKKLLLLARNNADIVFLELQNTPR